MLSFRKITAKKCSKKHVKFIECLIKYLYVVSTQRFAAARSAGGIQAGNEVPDTHLVHSNNPGSTLILVFPSF